jgi:hypothetical protein
MLIVGVVLILVGVLLPLVALTGLVPAPPDGVLPQLQVAFWALAIGIPLSAAGCTLAAVAIVLHRYGRELTAQPSRGGTSPRNRGANSS